MDLIRYKLRLTKIEILSAFFFCLLEFSIVMEEKKTRHASN